MATSPITAELLVSGAVGISEVIADGTDIYWAESRPSEGGRVAIVRARDGETEEITSRDANVRTRVHEYGGGAWWLQDATLVYSDDARGGELFVLDVASGDERQLTTAGDRYADGRLSPAGDWFMCVRERHDPDDPHAVENDVVAIRTVDGEIVRIAGGHDFFSSPCFGPDGAIAFIAWDHPNMPWDTTILHVGTFDGESATGAEVPSDGASVVLPGFASDGRLLAVSDRSNWWNLVEIDVSTGAERTLHGGHFEIATPGWVFGLSRWVETTDGVVVVAGTPDGDEIRFPNGNVERHHTAVSSIRSLADGRVCYAASSYGEESAVWVHDGTTASRVSTPRDLGLSNAWFPRPELVTFDVSSVDPSVAVGTEAHALFYEPVNPEVTLSGLPPLLVLVHGGPTSAARRQLNLVIRFWTSRGVAVADVDYRGSTLYGREFRHALHGQWGVSDTVDCVAAAKHLADAGRVDSDRMVIAGGSAGGMTVLNALARFDVFAGGICRYGVADLSLLAADTHKFEARYCDRLVGPWPEAQDVYIERSPITYASSIARPMLVLQGSDDKVVPPNQSIAIVDALKANDIPVTYLEFPGEGHGFRQSDTIVDALAAEERFISSL